MCVCKYTHAGLCFLAPSFTQRLQSPPAMVYKLLEGIDQAGAPVELYNKTNSHRVNLPLMDLWGPMACELVSLLEQSTALCLSITLTGL